jgi:acetyl esterase/lipase
MVADQLGAVVAAPHYRKAPEHPFPTPLHDCYEALRWLATQPDINHSRIAIGGASAGGGLAAALALLARDRAEIRPTFQLLSYPMLDDRTAVRNDLDERDIRLWNGKSNRYGWTAYLGQPPGRSEVTPLAAPGRAEDLSGLPPAWIGVATRDILYQEGLAYAERLREADVPCEVHTAEGAFHGFDSVKPNATITHQFRHAQIEALRQH